MMAMVPVALGKASVLYTFYPPMIGSPFYYLGVVLVVSVAVVVANLIVDIAYPFVDPRIRLTGKGDTVAASRGLRRELRAQQHQVTESAG